MSIQLVAGWQKLHQAWSVRFAALGIVLPDLLQLLADNSDLLDGFDAGYKSIIRLVCLVGVVLARPVKQKEIAP